MRPKEPWRRAVKLMIWQPRGEWERCVDRRTRETLDKWQWSDLHQLADCLSLTPFEVLKQYTPQIHDTGAALFMITPLPVPGDYTVGWIKTLLRPDLTKEFSTESPFSYAWRRENLGTDITYPLPYVEVGSPFRQATASLMWFVNNLRDEYPIMVPLRWGNQILQWHQSETGCKIKS